MTTIAYRDNIMAGDTAMTDRGTYCGQYRKIYEMRGALLGVCGCLGEVAKLRDWFIAGTDTAPPEFTSDDSEALLVHLSGRVEWIGHPGRRMDITGDFHAIGSGFRLALGAMSAGATAEQAVEIACDLDIYTRRPIDVLVKPVITGAA